MTNVNFEFWQHGEVSGWLHRPRETSNNCLVLTHGAGGNCRAPLLVTIADAFYGSNVIVLRTDLAFRRRRPSGPPSPATSALDRDGLRNAVLALRETFTNKVFLGGHSYGGRQASLLAAEEPQLVNGLLLLSYPLHPPKKLQQLRTAHFPELRTPALFVHGDRDPFGSPEEMWRAIDLIPVHTELTVIEGAGHDLKGAKFPLADDLPAKLRALGETNLTSKDHNLR